MKAVMKKPLIIAVLFVVVIVAVLATVMGVHAFDGSSNEKQQSSEGESASIIGAMLVVDDTHAQPGQTQIQVPVRIERNPGILGMTVSVSFDEQSLTLTGARNGSAFSMLSLTTPESYENGCIFMWDGLEIANDQVKDGEILVLSFDVAAQAAPGAYPVAVRTSGTAVNNDLSAVSVSVQDGYVLVE